MRRPPSKECPQRRIEIIEDIAKGNSSDDVMPLTAGDPPVTVRVIAEALAVYEAITRA